MSRSLPVGSQYAAALAVVRAVAERRGLSLAQVRGPSRLPSIVRARDEAGWLLRTQLHLSYPEAATVLARDHSSVLVAVRRFEARLSTDVALAVEIMRLTTPAPVVRSVAC